jgi:hypothetical protein
MTTASQARQMAERIRRLHEEVRASFQSTDADQRRARLLHVANEIAVGMLSVNGWLERRRPAETADLFKRRMMFVLNEAVQCAGLDIPEFAGGMVVQAAGELSLGAERTAALLVTAKALAASLLDWADDIEEEDQQRPPAGKTPPATIVSLDDRRYRVGDSRPVVVSDVEDTVLQAFADESPMDASRLIDKAGFDRAPRVLKSLREKYSGIFAPAITCPGRKGQGGYHVAIQQAQE